MKMTMTVSWIDLETVLAIHDIQISAHGKDYIC